MQGQPYRPVPGGRYMMEPEDEIDFVELARKLWKDRWLIAKITGVFVVLGLFIALFSPEEYKTSAVIMPELQSNQSRAGSLLQQYGGLLGISGGAATAPEGTIPPQLYPEIVESVSFKLDLMNREIRFEELDTTVTTHEYYSSIHRSSILGYIKGYTLGLPGKILGLFSADEEDSVDIANPELLGDDEIYTLSEKQKETIDILRERISINHEQESGVLTFTVEMPDPRAAAELGKAGLALLKEYVRDYQTRKAAEDLEFIRGQVADARKRFDEVKNKRAEFLDSNLSLTSARAKAREQEINSEYDLAFNVYNSLSQQLEQAKIRVQENTPVFSVLKPITEPLERSKPDRKFILVISLVIGTIISAGWSMMRTGGREFMEKVLNED